MQRLIASQKRLKASLKCLVADMKRLDSSLQRLIASQKRGDSHLQRLIVCLQRGVSSRKTAGESSGMSKQGCFRPRQAAAEEMQRRCRDCWPTIPRFSGLCNGVGRDLRRGKKCAPDEGGTCCLNNGYVLHSVSIHTPQGDVLPLNRCKLCQQTGCC